MPEYLDLPVLPADIAFGLVADYEADQHPQKVSLVAGAYRDAKGLPWILPSVKQAKERIAADPASNHEYLGIAGSPTYLELAKSLVFGSELTGSRNIASIQTVSGTGANHVGALFLAQSLKPSQVFIPDPTWLNHKTIWTQAGPHVVQKEYPYYSADRRAIDFDDMISTLETQAQPRDVVILQACAHNPTGLDLSRDQWRQVADVVARKKLFALFDSAYQGFATGDVEADVWSVRYFTERLFAGQEDHPGLCVAQSFSKNFGLYGERVGALHLVTPANLSLHGARSHLSLMARAEYSNPPRFGSRIVETVLGDEELRAQWRQDLDTMSARIRGIRGQLRRKLEALGTPGDWSHIEEQIGMFSYTGLKKEQVERLKTEYHVYLLPSGRASLCGLNEDNVEYVARAISDVVRRSG
ncbi:aspartate aminotransferase/Glutamic oxaloacetic transaminase [Aspergillus steynii IBT 23096]|uniref:Aspartate aminotransferase n=1 Tax=Aspergillus steynii IBT 23096 TaxID=1392250 RepID=A0A2I2G543_9EURO|nr:aspartate aminotransferase/Glutamic oxaloacetic transaminase [Aspergillus steynii IBT 23096]PLB47998.1 aspartate aminotransferase/Glutamic oxaloacetic transaminase [Aspergillus steynii IBT 23096]